MWKVVAGINKARINIENRYIVERAKRASIYVVFTTPQLVFTCSKVTIETLEQVVKYVQS